MAFNNFMGPPMSGGNRFMRPDRAGPPMTGRLPPPGFGQARRGMGGVVPIGSNYSGGMGQTRPGFAGFGQNSTSEGPAYSGGGTFKGNGMPGGQPGPMNIGGGGGGGGYIGPPQTIGGGGGYIGPPQTIGGITGHPGGGGPGPMNIGGGGGPAGGGMDWGSVLARLNGGFAGFGQGGGMQPGDNMPMGILGQMYGRNF